VYRAAWDDFSVTAVHGSKEARAALLGQTTDLATWAPLLDERFLRHGAYLFPHGSFDWSSGDLAHFIPALAGSEGADAWHPEDALLVPLAHSDGHLLGIMSVDEPRSGRRPSDEEIEVLAAVSAHAALALQEAQERAEAARHREERQLASGDADRARPAIRAPVVGVGEAQSRHRHVRDRDRQHRAECVEVPQERRLAGDQRHAGDRAEHEDAEPRRAVLRVQLAHPVGHLAVQAHRVDQP